MESNNENNKESGHVSSAKIDEAREKINKLKALKDKAKTGAGSEIPPDTNNGSTMSTVPKSTETDEIIIEEEKNDNTTNMDNAPKVKGNVVLSNTIEKKKLLHIMLGNHNPDMQRGLESIFDCKHIDWTVEFIERPVIKEIDQRTEDLKMVHGFDPRNPSGETRRQEYPNVSNDSPNEGSTEFDAKLLDLFNSFKPDIVFIQTQKDRVVSLDSIKHMRKTAKIINWTGDVRYPIPEFYKRIGKEIDITLFTNMEDVEEMRRLLYKADFLQVGFDSVNFSPDGDIINAPVAKQIVYMGNNYGKMFPLSEIRETMVKTLKEVFGNKVGIFGTGWGELGDGSIDNYEMEGKVYRSCDIAISLSHFDRTKYASDRLFRIMGSGAFCISHEYKAMEEDFEIGDDLETFQSIPELIAKIKYYLEEDNIQTRETIAFDGCQKVRLNHTWQSFAQNLEKLATNLTTKTWKD